MAHSFTPGQKKAIEHRGESILVSAAAGSGKTSVLTERLMGYISDEHNPCDIDSFLIITYTRAAAAELRGRIIAELGKKAAAEPGNRALRRQQNLCYSARIGTIHSFCAEVLRENCHLLGLSPSFKVMDEDRGDTMKAACLENLLEKRYESIGSDDDFRLLVDTVGAGRDDSRLSGIVLSLHEKLSAHPYPMEFAQSQIELLSNLEDCAAGDTPWGQEIISGALSSAAYWAEEMQRLTEEIYAHDEKIAKAYGESFAVTAEGLADFARALRFGWDKARSALPVEFPRLKGLTRYDDPDFARRCKALREKCKDACKTYIETFADTSEALMSDMLAIAPAMTALLRLAMDFDAAFAAEKRRGGFMDFSDLEHFSCRLLVDGKTGEKTELAREISQRFTEIMVDEYQDVNAVQDTIFRAVSRDESNLFMVGDVKQSIYRFRLADPGIFLEKYRRFGEDGSGGTRILLQENFRSRKCVLDAANSVFSSIMSRELGEMEYDEDASLKCGNLSYPREEDKKAQLCLIQPEDSPDDEETPEKSRQEALFVASKIQEMVERGERVYENGIPRPCSYGDFVILMRSPGTKGQTFCRALAEYGIPVQSQQSGGFFTSLEVSTAVNFLSIIDNPHADVPLIAVLRSPVFGFSGDELAQIRAVDKNSDFYTALCAAAEGGDEKCAAFLQKLGALRALSRDMSLDELIWHLYNETDLLSLCAAMSDSELRRNNLMYLFQSAKRFEETGYKGLFRFVSWLRRQAERGDEPSVSAGAENAVRIMSIHKSKGLEFPFVFLCDLSHRFNTQDLKESVLIHSELGLGPKYTDTARRTEYPTLARRAIERRMKRESLSEEMRVLYVAMTRAKERLFMTMVVNNVQKTVDALEKVVTSPVPPALLLTADCPGKFLLMAALCDGGNTIDISEVCACAPDETEEDIPQEPSDEPESADCTGEYEELKRNLSWQYPHLAAASLPTKLTATELKGRFTAEDVSAEDAELVKTELPMEFRQPRLDGGKALTAAQRGTATHSLLQHICLSRAGSAEEIRQEIQRLCLSGFLTKQEAEVINADAVCRFFSSPVGQRLRSAEKVYREFPFTLLADAGDYFEGAEGEELLLQGVIDCFMVEEDGISLIDYKTDRVSKAEAPMRAALYEGQLKTYAAALRRITGKEVKQCLIYFLRPGEIVEIPLK